MDDNIDYDKLSTLTANKLRSAAMAVTQGKIALEDEWLSQFLTNWIINNQYFIARYVVNNQEFDQAFKAKLKQTIANIY